MSDNYLITSEYSVPLDGQLPSEVMYFPAGRSTLTPSVNGKAQEISVDITPKTADTLQADLDQLLKGNVRPFIDFAHSEGAAAALPKRFYWKDGEGVMLELDWTGAGKSAVGGRDFSYLSPTFLISKENGAINLPSSGPVASLVNNPAFRAIKKIYASHEAINGGDTDNNKTKENMDKVMSKLVSLGFITEADSSDPEKVTAALESYVKKGSENAELVSARAKIAALEAAAETQRVEAINRDADLLIEAAVKDGKIAPKNETVKASLKRWAVTDLAGAKAHIESLPVNPAFKTVVPVTSAHRDVGNPSGTASGEECKAIVKKIQASHEGMSWDDAWSIAESEHPEKFGKIKVAA